MNYDKLRKLEREYEDWFDERVGAKSVAWVDERRVAKVTLEHHRYLHFDELVAVLEQCNPDGDWESEEDLETFKKLRKDVLARAKEVKM